MWGGMIPAVVEVKRIQTLEFFEGAVPVGFDQLVGERSHETVS